MSEELLYRLENRVAVLTLNRPERLNALTKEMMQGLRERLSACAVDDAVGCVVITGAGGAFCAGGDVRAQARVAAEGTAETPERRTDLLRASMEERPLYPDVHLYKWAQKAPYFFTSDSDDALLASYAEAQAPGGVQ